MSEQSATITGIDFFTIPTQDGERSRVFYSEVLGLEESERTQGKPFSEFDLSGTTLSIWDPTSAGQEFAANTQPVALHTDDLPAMRKLLEDKGVTFFGETIDTGVCRMAIFPDPDGNPLMLHSRYVPHG